MNILVVVDDISFGRDISARIARWGYSVELCETGRSALTRFNQNPFDLVLLDLSLPDAESMELIPWFKKLCPETGMITMTDRNSWELEGRTRALGIFFYMIKPDDTECLKLVLNHNFERMRVKNPTMYRKEMKKRWLH